MRIKWGFLYNEYRPNSYLWEFVKMYTKIFVTIILNIYDGSIPIKGTLIFLIIFLYGFLSLKFKPYISYTQNLYDASAALVCAVSYILGIFLYNN